jgi:hypothetical protein
MKSFFPDPPHRITELKTGLLMFFIGNEHLYSVLWSHWGAVCITKIMRCEEIASLIDEFQAVFDPYSPKQKISSAFKNFIYVWGARLVPDAGVLADYHLLTIIPHQSLHGLPFHAIWIEHNERHLGVTHGISYCSSTTLLLRCADRNIRRLGINISSNNDTDSCSTPSWLPSSCITVATDVTGQRNDIYCEIAAEFSRYFSNSYPLSSTRLFKYQVDESQASPICIVCHGYIDKEKPTSSGLILDFIKPNIDSFFDTNNPTFNEIGAKLEKLPMGVKGLIFDENQFQGLEMVSGLSFRRNYIERPIFVDENCRFFFRDLPFRHTPLEFESARNCEAMTIDELCVDVETNASLVALFACHSGAGNEIIGDDYTSSAYQWLKVGAASALANCWEADVGVIKEFSSRFMDHWIKNRRPKAIAFRLALSDYMEAHPESVPYEWAVISLFGDWL